MTIYIDNDYRCYTESAKGRTAVDTPFFDGKCKGFIEGYRFVPQGQTWTRADGVQFKGEMVSPWRNYNELAELQAQYEDGIDSQTDTIAGLMDDIEELCNELIGG